MIFFLQTSGTLYIPSEGWNYGALAKSHAGDAITIDLDLEARTLSFWKNDVLMGDGGPAVTNIKKGTYRLAVYMLLEGDCVEIA